MRYIDADRLISVLQTNFGHTGGADVLKQLINEQPTADVEEVVRCKDCKYSERYEACDGSFPLRCNEPKNIQIGIPDNHFCSYGVKGID